MSSGRLCLKISRYRSARLCRRCAPYWSQNSVLTRGTCVFGVESNQLESYMEYLARICCKTAIVQPQSSRILRCETESGCFIGSSQVGGGRWSTAKCFPVGPFNTNCKSSIAARSKSWDSFAVVTREAILLSGVGKLGSELPAALVGHRFLDGHIRVTTQLLLPHAAVCLNHKSTLLTKQRFYTIFSESETSDVEVSCDPCDCASD
jgi:hypothetical protein